MQERCGLTRAPLFAPAVIPAHRGMVTEVPLPLAAMAGAGTPEAMRDYLGSFDPRIRGFRGTPSQLATMAKAYKVQYRRVPLDGGDYTMDHTAAVILIDARGRFAGTVTVGFVGRCLSSHPCAWAALGPDTTPASRRAALRERSAPGRA